jgi:uncharacterized protein (TIRG00374 family)
VRAVDLEDLPVVFGLLGCFGWFAFDIAVLWACISAFGTAPSVPVVVMAYFVGMAANTLPVPGGVGAVEGGMVGALIGFGVSGGLAIVAVLSYRAFASWLPMVPGAIAYVQLLRSPADPEPDPIELGPRAPRKRQRLRRPDGPEARGEGG